MKQIFILTLLIIIPLRKIWAETPKQITLSERTVSEIILKQGLKTLEVNLRYQQFRLDPIRTLSAYDWNLKAESGYEFDRSASILTSGTSTTSDYKRYRSTLSLTKPFTSGTLLGIEINQLSQNGNTDLYLDSAGVVLEQALLGNFFGIADRATIRAADLAYEANNIAYLNELEDVVLEATRQFWDTYVLAESYQQAINSRDRYKTLVTAVKRKTQLGYSNPGDLPQVLAEFETREQRVKTASQEYSESVENLLTLLAIDSSTEVKFNVAKEISPLPRFNKKNLEELRAIRAQKLRLEAAKENLDIAESLKKPTLNLVGRASNSGLSDSQQDAYTQLGSGTYPKYYVGLKFQYNFGSNVQEETVINRRITQNLEEARLRRFFLEAHNLDEQAQRNVQTNYDIAASAKKQRDFREQASRELNRSYSQGRTDISILITAMNNLFDSEVKLYRAIGDYAISLNEWTALRDELVSDDIKLKSY